jgi:DNA-binding CsgD family transcriptional regulator
MNNINLTGINNNEEAEIADNFELKKKEAEIRIKKRKDGETERSDIKSVLAIPRTFIVWLWNGIIAFGKLGIIASDPGMGKSLISLYLAAMLSIGKPLMNENAEICDTLILSGEDDFGDTIRPRLEALGADLKRIHKIEGRIAKDGRKSFSISDIETIRDAIDKIRAKGGRLGLMIIDPIDSFLGGKNAFRNNSMREAFEGILRLAAEEQFAILGIAHLNKRMTAAAYRVGGSIAFTAMARSVYLLAKDPQDPERRVMLPLKNNLAKDLTGYEYSIQETVEGIPYIKFERKSYDNIDRFFTPCQLKKIKTSPEQEEILSILEEIYPESMSTGEIAKKLGKKKNDISMLLGKLVKKGKVENPRYGKYLITIDSANSEVSTETDINETIETAETNEIAV